MTCTVKQNNIGGMKYRSRPKPGAEQSNPGGK